jgi:DHA2 family multidrug resistance protein
MLFFGLVIASAAFFGYSTMNLQSGTWDILVHQINQGAGQTLLFVPLTIVTMELIPKRDIAYATSLYSVTRNIGSSMGISFVTTWVARRSQFHQSRLSGHISLYNLQTQQSLNQLRMTFMQHGADWTTATHQALAAISGSVQQQATLLSFVDVFYLLGWLFLLSTPLVLLMRKPKSASSAPVVVLERRSQPRPPVGAISH